MLDHTLVASLVVGLAAIFIEPLRSWVTVLATVSLAYVTTLARRWVNPGVQHPSHCEDAAMAVAWVHKHAHEFGADPERITIVGHSAGSHLAMMLCVCPSFLRDANGPQAKTLHGVMAMSGPYCAEIMARSWLLRTLYLYPVFGNHPTAWHRMFPVGILRDCSAEELKNIRLPPTLIVNVEKDWGLEEHAPELEETLLRTGDRASVRVERRLVDGLNHFNSMTGVGKRGHRANVLIDIAVEWATQDREAKYARLR